jgi:hypothetical protein
MANGFLMCFRVILVLGIAAAAALSKANGEEKREQRKITGEGSGGESDNK